MTLYTHKLTGEVLSPVKTGTIKCTCTNDELGGVLFSNVTTGEERFLTNFQIEGLLKKMTPAKQAKALGLKSITSVADSLGFKANGNHVVSLQTLDNWAKHKPLLFKTVLLGCKAKIDARPYQL